MDGLHGDPVLPNAQAATLNGAVTSPTSGTLLTAIQNALAAVTVAPTPTVTGLSLTAPADVQSCAEVLMAVGGVPAALPLARAAVVSAALVAAVASNAVDNALAPLLPVQSPLLTPTSASLYGDVETQFFGPPPPSPSPPPPVPFAPPHPDSPPAPTKSVGARLKAGDEGTIVGLIVGVLIGGLVFFVIVNTLINRARIAAQRKINDELYKRKVMADLLQAGRTTPPELILLREKQAAAAAKQAAKMARTAAATVSQEAVPAAGGAPPSAGRRSRSASRAPSHAGSKGSRRAPSAPGDAPKRG